MDIDALEIHEDGFYEVVYRPSAEEVFLFSQPGTLAWWEKQSPEAKVVLEHCMSRQHSLPLPQALMALNDFVRRHGGKEARVWGNGADFDNGILASAYAACNLEPSWAFWHNRCYRTVKAMAKDIKLDRSGTYHNALDDARSQAQHMLKILDERDLPIG